MWAAYRYELLKLSTILFSGGIVGWIIKEPSMGLCLGLLLYLSRHLYQLLVLHRKLRKKRHLQQPFPKGLWGIIYKNIYYYQQNGRKRKRNLTRFVARFRDATSTVPDAVVILDQRLRVIWANPATPVLLGFNPSLIDKSSILDLVNDPSLAEYIHSGTYSQPLEMTPAHNGALVLSVQITPFGAKKRQRLLVARDITQVYHLHQIRKDFVANVSHELRTPLTAINGYMENLQDMPTLPVAMQHPLRRIHVQITRMTALINDLLALSRLEVETKAAKRIPLNVGEMLDSIILEAKTQHADCSIELVADYDLWIRAGESELHSAISNLILNAIKHNPSGTKIAVRWYAGYNGPVLSVQDTGEGIAPEHIPRLTERFYRVDKGRSRISGGTGLGLAIVKHVLNRHEAKLFIASTLGQGSTFTCQFPKAARYTAVSITPHHATGQRQ